MSALWFGCGFPALHPSRLCGSIRLRNNTDCVPVRPAPSPRFDFSAAAGRPLTQFRLSKCWLPDNMTR